MGEAALTSLYPLLSTFNRGEISPLLASRVDIDSWRQSLSYCRNFHVLTHGGLRRRSGSRYIAELKNSAQVARLLPFKFSEDQSYILALNGGVFRFYALRGVLGAPYELAHPWSTATLPRLSYDQFNDVGYFAHKSYQPRKLSRKGDTNWTLDALTFKDGPYLKPGMKSTTLTLGGYNSFVPKMTDNTSPSGTAASDASSATAFQVFDKDPATDGVLTSSSTGWVSYQATSAKVTNAYWLQASSAAFRNEDMPTAWTMEGSNDGSTWVALDTQDGQTGWSGGERRYFTFENEIAYSYIRLNFKGGGTGSGSGSDTLIAEWEPNEAGDSQSPVSLIANNASGINGGSGFLASDVGRSIRLMGSDGKWRWAQIISRVSSTEVTVRVYGHAFPDRTPIANWRMGAWSASSGYPAAVRLFDERLMFARTDSEPVTVWGSKQGTFDDFGVSDPVLETDGLSITLLSSNMNEILWMAAEEDIIVGSAGQIRSVGPSDITKSFSATNITQRKGPTTGATFHEPLSVGGATLYVGQGGRKIRELVLGDQNRYIAPELTIFAEHMAKSGVKDWAFAEKPDPTVWVVMGDGLLTAITYDREQKQLGFARHDLGGMVENVAVIPGVEPGYDDVYVVVRRVINGSVKRYLEVLERPFDHDLDAIEDAFFVDCGLSYSGAAITTVTGLGHLEGQNVVALADGGVVRGLTVSSGQVTLPYAASKIHVGIPYTSRAVTLPYAGPGQDGMLFGRRKNVIAAFVDVLATGALKVGSAGSDRWTPDLIEQIMKAGDGLFGSPIDLQTGFVRCDFETSWAEGEGRLVMETGEPLPALVRSIELQVDSEP